MNKKCVILSKPFCFISVFVFTLVFSGGALAQCGDPATLISEIQGTSNESPLNGETHTVEAIVTGDFQGDDSLRGFFIQEESHDQDDDPLSSEGIFVFYPGNHVAHGQIVRITAQVQERFGQTQLARVDELVYCGNSRSGAVIVADLRLPLQSDSSLEAYEGMLVRLKGDLVVTDTFNLGRFGEFVVAAEERLYTPTQVAYPGAQADARQSENDLNRLIIDDGSNNQYPQPIPYPAPGLTAYNALRIGQEVKPVIGIMSYAFNQYRIHPTKEVRFKKDNKRPKAPSYADRNEHDHDAALRIASFNISNYFNGDGLGGGFPTPRGADSDSEFQRQSMKLGRALAGLDAAVIGIAELENDGYGDYSAIAALTNFANEYSRREYRYIDPGLDRLGSDDITVGFLYQPEKVTPKGDALTLSAPPFDGLSRQPLAQAFVVNATGLEILVVVNHFKSKSCSGASGEDRDQGDGQSCFNAARVQSVIELTQWIDGLSATPHKIIMGDLNSYLKEDPITALRDAGYRTLLNEQDYSYVFQGQSGTLDYVFYNASLGKSVKRVKVWHINADEPPILDYNEEQKSADQLTTLFHDDPYRSSDHDPVYIVLEFEEHHKE